ncbi:MAG: hypothetical protein QNL04_09500 [SAR324 cluster bacterium]|nr:hypothetical protein [SAR324 cluster bacterium]
MIVTAMSIGMTGKLIDIVSNSTKNLDEGLNRNFKAYITVGVVH